MSELLAKPSACAECGGDPVHHRATYLGILMEFIMRPVFVSGNSFAQRFSRAITVLEDLLGKLAIRIALALGRARLLDEPDDRTWLLAKVLWEEAGKRGIRMREFRLFDLPRNFFVANLADGRYLAFEGVPTPVRGAGRVWWLDDKAVMKRKFKKLGFPVAPGGSAHTFAGALRLFRSVVPPVIVKPHSGSGSRHTTIHVHDEKTLARAFSVARELSPLAMIEEELVGPVYRATVVDGRCVAVLRRDQPHVIGDGKKSIVELVAEANMHPARSGPYFSPLRLDATAHAELAWQDLSPESVPEAGRRVTLHQKVNWGTGGTTADVTEETHPDNLELFEAISRALKTTLVGIDFIIADISRSWKETERCGVIECNSMPFFDNHHLPFEGRPRNVAGAIWDMVGA